MPATYPHYQIAEKGYQKNGTVLAQSCSQFVYENIVLGEGFEAKIGETVEAGETGEAGEIELFSSFRFPLFPLLPRFPLFPRSSINRYFPPAHSNP